MKTQMHLATLSLLIISASFIFPSGQALAFSGPISGTTTWSGIVELTGDVWVTSTGTLTILSGTTVKSSPNVDDQIHGRHTSRIEIIVEPGGTLMAEGTSSNHILFTSRRSEPKQSGDWYGLRVQSNNVTLRYCDIDYGKDAIRVERGVPLIQNCSFTMNEFSGVTFAVSGSLSNCTMSANIGWGIVFEESPTVTITSSSITNN